MTPSLIYHNAIYLIPVTLHSDLTYSQAKPKLFPRHTQRSYG